MSDDPELFFRLLSQPPALAKNKLMFARVEEVEEKNIFLVRGNYRESPGDGPRQIDYRATALAVTDSAPAVRLNRQTMPSGGCRSRGL